MHVLREFPQELCECGRIFQNYNLRHLLHCVRRQMNATPPARRSDGDRVREFNPNFPG